MRITIVLLAVCACVRAQPEESLSDCRAALGMENGEIPDSALSASSTYLANVGPKSARIRTDLLGGAWCPASMIDVGVFEWLQIDFPEFKVITMVETQGRFGNGEGQEYTTNYLLEYQRAPNDRWLRYRDYKNREIIPGNSNTYASEVRELAPPIIARSLRFVPFGNHRRMMCMRVEVFGCSAEDKPISYTMREGESRGEIDLFDFFYDGNKENGILSGGLGQLTDLKDGVDNFRLDVQELGKKGYEWVGWRNDTSVATPPVSIVFTFHSVRNFSAVKIHCNNMHSKDVMVFRKAEVYFSVSGDKYGNEPVIYEFLRDPLMEFARDVTIRIPHRLGKFVKVLLWFDAKWILISEVTFESEPVVGQMTTESALPVPSSSTKILPTAPSRNTQSTETKPPQQSSKELTYDNSNEHHDSIEIEIVPSSSMSSDVPSEAEHRQTRMDDASIGIIIGTLAALILLLMVVFIITLLKRRKKKLSANTMKAMFASDHIHFNMTDLSPTLSNGKSSHGNTYNAIATTEENDKEPPASKTLPDDGMKESGDGIQSRLLPEPPIPNGTCSSQEYASADVIKYAGLVVNLPPQPIYDATAAPPSFHSQCSAPPPPPPAMINSRRESPPPPPPPPHPHPRAICAAAMDVVSIQGMTGNSMYVTNSDLPCMEELPVREFPREKVRFMEKLGEGQYGEVHVCEVMSMPELNHDGYIGSRTGSKGMLVAVKMLRPNASDHARADFHKEVRLMSQLKDPNIVCVLGVCCKEEPLAVVVEYMKQGDLHQFLLRHSAEGTIPRAGQAIISYGGLIYMCMQIASGMKYLETLNMVHRDLASRNCLVGYNYTIKISDFGMSRSLYSNDYYRMEGKAVLPIRWMAWESVLLGKFSCKSDVWSMGVTMWEVLTLARNHPYDLLSDEEVIENCGHYYRNDGNEICLPQPSCCPKEIFDLMRECWNRDEAQRPSFREIHMFLQRKNMGYDPREASQASGSWNSSRSSGPHA